MTGLHVRAGKKFLLLVYHNNHMTFSMIFVLYSKNFEPTPVLAMASLLKDVTVRPKRLLNNTNLTSELFKKMPFFSLLPFLYCFDFFLFNFSPKDTYDRIERFAANILDVVKIP